jgi:hypothetical protein
LTAPTLHEITLRNYLKLNQCDPFDDHDAAADDMSDCFDFNQTPLAPPVTGLKGEPVERPYLSPSQMP